MDVVVVLPTYNEAENIVGMLHRLLASAVHPDVLVVDDSSPDGTGALVSGVARSSGGRVSLLTRAGKEGLGAAYRDGFRAALGRGYDVIVQMDADGSHPVDALPGMLLALSGGADLVLGSRYCLGGGVAAGWPLHRRLLSRGGNLYARALLGLPQRDLTGGFKAWRAPLLRRLDLSVADAMGYAFQIQTTLAAVRAGARVVEVPITFVDRELGTSKMSAAVTLEAARLVLAMRRDRTAGYGDDTNSPFRHDPGGVTPALRACR